MNTKSLMLALLLLLIPWVMTHAQSDAATVPGPLVLSGEQGSYPLGLHLELLTDPSGRLTIDQVTSPPLANRFVASLVETPNLGFTDSAVWVRLRVMNETTDTDDWLLEVGFANMHYADLFVPAKDGTGFVVKQTGVLRPFATRDVPYHRIVFETPLPPASDQTFYLRFANGASMTLPLTLWTPKAFAESRLNEQLRLGMFYGGLLIILVYQLLLLLTLWDRRNFYFVLMLCSGLVTIASYDGLSLQYLWPKLYPWHTVILIVGWSLFMMAIALFADAFLQLKAQRPPLHKLMMGLAALWAVPVLVSPFVSYAVLIRIVTSFGLLTVVVAAVAGFARLREDGRIRFWPGAYYLVSWLGLLVSAAAVLSVRLGYLPSTVLSEGAWRLGMLWLATLWSLALANDMRRLQVETKAANRELRAAESRLRQFLEAMPVGVAIYDTILRPQFFNRRARQMFALDDQEGAPHPVLSQSLPEAVAALSVRQAGDAQPYPLERLPVTLALQGKWTVAEDVEASVQGRRMQLEVRASPVYGQDGAVEYAVTAFEDITARKQTEAELVEHRAHLATLVAARTLELDAANERLKEEVVERTQTAATLSQRLDELLSLNQVAHTLSGMTELKLALETVAGMLAALFDASETLIAVVEAGQFRIVAGVTGGAPAPALPNHFFTLSDNLDLAAAPDQGRAVALAGASVIIPRWSEGWGEHPPQTWLLAPLRVRALLLGLIVIGDENPGRLFSVDQLILAETIAADVAAAIENARLNQEAQEAAALAERNRLARELHDSVTQTLYSVAAIAEAVPDLWQRYPDEALAGLADLRKLSRAALAEMRTLLLELRPDALLEKSLGDLLSQLTEATEGSSQIGITTTVSNDRPLPPRVQIALYRIAQESLNNVIRHSGASQAAVGLYCTGERVLLRVSDNGRGFDPDRQTSATTSSGSLGIGIMTERAQDIGAFLSIQSRPGKGTEVQVTWTDKGNKP